MSVEKNKKNRVWCRYCRESVVGGGWVEWQWVILLYLDSAGCGGSNGAKLSVWQWVLWLWWLFWRMSVEKKN
jgi:hypothetical protein